MIREVRTPDTLLSPTPDGRGFDAWSTLRLSFDSKLPSQKAFKTMLASAGRGLAASSGEMLEAVFTGERLAQECDAENVLHYNVGVGNFRDATRYGVRFERLWARPSGRADEAALAAPVATHHGYRVVPCETPSRHWRIARNLMTIRGVPVGTLDANSKPDPVWLATRMRMQGSVAPHHGPYGLQVRWRALRDPGLGDAVKVLLDGIVSALHVHDGRDLEALSSSVSSRLGLPAAEVAHLLMDHPSAVLGRRRLLWPRAGAHQWNPGDDACATATVQWDTDGTGDPGTMDIEVVAVEPLS